MDANIDNIGKFVLMWKIRIRDKLFSFFIRFIPKQTQLYNKNAFQ